MSRLKNIFLTGMIFIILGASVFLTSSIVKGKTWKDKGMMETIVLPDSEIMQRASLGYTNLAADLIWLRTIRYINIHNKGDKKYPELPRFFKLITDLDENFKDIYRVGGEALRELSKDPKSSISLLEKGRSIYPDDWKIAYESGRSYSLTNQWELATKSFEESLKMPEAPEWIAIHVAEGYYRQRDYMKSLYWWFRISSTTNNKEVAAMARSKVLYLDTLIPAIRIAESCKLFWEKYRRLPHDPEELVRAGFLDFVPEEPFNGRFVIDRKNFTIESTYISSLLLNCLEELSAKVRMYKDKHGNYPVSIDDLKNDEELGLNFPMHPYEGEYYIDHSSKRVMSTKDYLARIEIN